MKSSQESYVYYSPAHTVNIVLIKEPRESLKKSHMNTSKEPYIYHSHIHTVNTVLTKEPCKYEERAI